MCSTDRMPAPVERSTSATDWSRWKSTKWWCQSSGVPGLAGDQPQLAGRGGGLRLAERRTAAMADSKPAAMAAAAPAEMPSARTVREFEAAAAGADGLLVRDHGARHKGRQVVVPAQLALALGVQVHQRAPAAGDCQQVAGDLFDAGGEFAVVVDAADGDAVQRGRLGGRPEAVLATALPISTRVPASTAAAATAVRLRAGVDDGGDLDAGGAQVRGQGVGAVVGGADDHALTRRPRRSG